MSRWTDALLVGGAERVGNGDRDVEDLTQGQPAGPDALGEARALDLLHHEKEFSGGLLDAVNRDDVGVIECRDGACLAPEPLEPLRVRCGFLGQHLERDAPFELGVERLPHDSHPALAELGGDLELADPGTDHPDHSKRTGPAGEPALNLPRETARRDPGTVSSCTAEPKRCDSGARPGSSAWDSCIRAQTSPSRARAASSANGFSSRAKRRSSSATYSRSKSGQLSGFRIREEPHDESFGGAEDVTGVLPRVLAGAPGQRIVRGALATVDPVASQHRFSRGHGPESGTVGPGIGQGERFVDE